MINFQKCSLKCLLLLLLITACTSKEEKARALYDLEFHQQKIVEFKQQIALIEQKLENSEAELEVAKDDINQVKQFQLLRTESEREAQIRTATKNKIEIEKYIHQLNNQMQGIEDSIFSTEMQINQLKEVLKN